MVWRDIEAFKISGNTIIIHWMVSEGADVEQGFESPRESELANIANADTFRAIDIESRVWLWIIKRISMFSDHQFSRVDEGRD